MYAIRSYYVIQIFSDAIGQVQGIAVFVDTAAPGLVVASRVGPVPDQPVSQIEGNRITSYNVCYTKLLRRFPDSLAARGRKRIEILHDVGLNIGKVGHPGYFISFRNNSV